MKKRRLLVVTFAYPPSTAVEGLRWSLMAKYLERMGHEVTVVTSTAYAHGTDRGGGGERVIRTWDLGGMNALRGLLRRPRLQTGSEGALVTPAPRVLTSVVVPDAKVLSWVPFALSAATRAVRERGIDCVITTSPTESTHLIGLATRRHGPAWIADFRDGWVFETTRSRFPTRIQRRVDSMLEALVVERADATVSVTEELVADFRRRHGSDTAFVPNAWDPELGQDADRVAGAAEHGRRDRGPTLVYTGSLGVGTERRSRSESFLRVFERFSMARAAPPLELVIAGRTSPSDLALLSSLECQDAITHVGLLPRRDSHRLQKSANALLLIGSDRSVATAKLYEYLGAQRPILHVGGPSAISRILSQTGAGITVPDDNGEAIMRELRRIADGEFGRELAPTSIERYSFPFVAEQMAEVVEEAITRRAARL